MVLTAPGNTRVGFVTTSPTLYGSLSDGTGVNLQSSDNYRDSNTRAINSKRKNIIAKKKKECTITLKLIFWMIASTEGR